MRRKATIPIFVILAAFVLLGGCHRITAPSGTGYKTLFNSSSRDLDRARSKHELAIERLCESDYCAAEQLLRDSLIFDPSYGPSHNTLGKLYFDQRKFYLAAWEFEHASAQMPHRAEPLNNLGLVYEAVGEYDKAIQYFESAWSYEEDNAQFLGNLVRARIRSGDRSFDLTDLLRRLIQIEDRSEWIDWARSQLELNRIDDISEVPKVVPEDASPLTPRREELPPSVVVEDEIGDQTIEDKTKGSRRLTPAKSNDR